MARADQRRGKICATGISGLGLVYCLSWVANGNQRTQKSAIIRTPLIRLADIKGQFCTEMDLLPNFWVLRSHPIIINNHVWTWKRRKGEGKGKEPIQPRGTSVPRWSCPQIPAQGKLRWARWRRCPRLLGGRSRVPHCWDPRVGWQRRSWQQEDENHPPSSSTRHP